MQRDPERREIAAARRVPHQRVHLASPVPGSGKRSGKVTAGEPRCAGYEDPHRSATSVAGDPKISSR
jgi:hypothetical protein